MELPGFENHRPASITKFLCSQEIREFTQHKKLRSEWLNNAKLNKQFPQRIAVQDSPQTNPDHDSQAMSYQTIMS